MPVPVLVSPSVPTMLPDSATALPSVSKVPPPALSVMARLVDSFVSRAPDPEPVAGLADLTERECDVLRSMARGRSNAEIAAELYLAETTVKTHVARILAKLQVRDRVQAVVLAHRAGLDPD